MLKSNHIVDICLVNFKLKYIVVEITANNISHMVITKNVLYVTTRINKDIIKTYFA